MKKTTEEQQNSADQSLKLLGKCIKLETEKYGIESGNEPFDAWRLAEINMELAETKEKMKAVNSLS